MAAKRTMALMLGLGFGAGVAIRQARAGESDAAILQRQTQELVDAISNGTPEVWERYLDDRALYVDESGGVSTKKEMVGGIRPLPEGVTGTIRVQDFRVEVHGETAVATYIDDEDETYHGHALHCQYRTTDTWKKTAAGWRLVAGVVEALRTDPPAMPIPAALRAEYCGRYSLTPDIAYEIICAGDTLRGQRTGRKPEELRVEAPDVLFVRGQPRYRYVFQRGADGRIEGFAQRREAWDLNWKRDR